MKNSSTSYSVMFFMEKTKENVRNRIKVEIIEKDDIEKILQQRSKLTFRGIHRTNRNYDSYTFKQNEVLIDKSL